MLMENIQAFIGAAKNYGVPDEEMFLTPDLFEGRNLPQVRLDLMFVPRIIFYQRAYYYPSLNGVSKYLLFEN